METPKENIPLVIKDIKLIELRNYLIRPGRRNEFINYFENNFIESQNELGATILGQYRVKGAEDNFFWIRGFKDMATRKEFLNDFYYGSFWKQHRNAANSMILNNDNVHLLKPLDIEVGGSSKVNNFNTNWFGQKGVTVVDFYISNTKLDKLTLFVRNQYAPILGNMDAGNSTFWVSETTPNDFTGLPVFQDKNLLVQISLYKDEAEYVKKKSLVDARMNEEQRTEMADLVTVKNTLIIYPTERSLSGR